MGYVRAMATAFDTLTIARSIRNAGIDEPAAEAITQAIAAAISRERETLATKDDLNATKSELKAEIARLDNKVDLSEQRLIAKMSELHNRTLTVMFGFLLGFGSLIVAAIKLL